VENAPKALVLDTSVAIKWFIEEQDTDRALLVRERYIERRVELIAPDLIVYEMITVMAEHPGMGEDALEQNLGALFGLQIDLLVPSTDLARKTAINARKLGISGYDSSYLSLAEYLGTYVVTADRDLHRRVKSPRRTLLLSELGKTWDLP
jgi:predicted nucleic acid-binding protein